MPLFYLLLGSRYILLLYAILAVYSPPPVDRIWGIWGSYYNIPKAIFYLLVGDYNPKPYILSTCRGDHTSLTAHCLELPQRRMVVVGSHKLPPR